MGRRQFNHQAPKGAWVCDITYVCTGSGWLYLPAVLDLFPRKIVGDGTEHASAVGEARMSTSLAKLKRC